MQIFRGNVQTVATVENSLELQKDLSDTLKYMTQNTTVTNVTAIVDATRVNTHPPQRNY